ncbi:MAG: YdeI/OmpD-associated family protein [Candidatus Pacearchaeota archaeon]
MVKNIATGTIHKMSPELQRALINNPKALQRWNSLTPLARNEWICWVTFVKKDKTKKEHIKRMIKELKDGISRPCCWIGCAHRTDKSISPSVQGILKRQSKKLRKNNV